VANYLIAHVKVNDDSWMPEYAEKVHDIVHRHNGKYLARSANLTALEGELPDIHVVALIEFPTSEDLQAFASDPDYAPFAEARQGGTDSVLFAIDSTDVAGTIPYLDAAG
jgi:uncharacterized protein (DUF1330 family)